MSQLPAHIAQELQQIAQDNCSGAAELYEKALYVLQKVLNVELSSEHRLTVLRNAVLTLVRGQPAMAPMWNLANGILEILDRSAPAAEIESQLATYLADAIEQYQSSLQRLARNFASCLPKSAAILTHSYSSTVLQVLSILKGFDFELRIVCTESRPGNEGVWLASQLTQLGFPVTLIVDSAVYRVAAQVDLFVTGADVVARSGIVNKIGTSYLALTAQKNLKPYFVLTTDEKLLLFDEEFPLDEPRSPEEIVPQPVPFRVFNVYFERIPLDWASKIITAGGTFSPEDLLARFGQKSLQPGLRQLLEELMGMQQI